MKFSKELTQEAMEYLIKKTGQKADKGVTERFLTDVAVLGRLFLKSTKKLDHKARMFEETN